MEPCILGFSEKYNVNMLVYVETYQDIREAIYREKCFKCWKRSWKLKLISEINAE
jgi:putative endonuclease